MPIRPKTSNQLRCAAWFGAALFGTALAFSAQARPNVAKAETPEIAAKQADLSELRSRIESLRKDLASSESNKAHASDRLRESEREISNLQRDLHNLASQRGELQRSLKDLNRQAQELEGTLAQQQIRLEKLLLRQYMRGSPDSLQLLLNGDDPNQLARDLHYLAAIGTARSELLAGIRANLEKKQALTEDTQEQADELGQVEAAQKQRHGQLLQQRNQRKTVLSEISGRISSQRKAIGNLQQDEKRMSQLIERLSRLLAARAAKRPAKEPSPKGKEPTRKEPTGPAAVEAENTHLPAASSGSFARQKGSLRLPLRGTVIGRFGAPREGSSTWKGLFIRAGQGSEVKAIAEGRVVFAEWMRGFGNLLIIDHGDAYLSIYGNNDSLLKQVGDTVKGGDTVASVGNSGGNPETGLYFELRHQGQALDPMKWASIK